MKNQIISLVLLLALESCKIVYQETPIKDAVGKGRAVYIKSGFTLYFDDIILKDGVYYGISARDTIQFSQLDAYKILKRNNYNVRIRTDNRQTVHGYLHHVKDSSIVISSWSGKIDTDLMILDQYQEIKVKNIDEIKIGSNAKVRKGYFVGTSIGIGFGALVGGLMTVYAIFPFAGTFGILGSLIGLSVGSQKETIEINGSLNQYKHSKYWLQGKSAVVEDID